MSAEFIIIMSFIVTAAAQQSVYVKIISTSINPPVFYALIYCSKQSWVDTVLPLCYTLQFINSSL